MKTQRLFLYILSLATFASQWKCHAEFPYATEVYPRIGIEAPTRVLDKNTSEISKGRDADFEILSERNSRRTISEDKSAKDAHEMRLSIVPPQSQISDFETKFALAKLLSYQKNTQNKALRLLKTLLEENPSDKRIYLEIARILEAKNEDKLALQFLNALFQEKTDPSQAAGLINLIPQMPAPGSLKESPTLVSQEGLISNYDARYALAQIFSHHEETYDLALRQFRILQLTKPQEPMLYLGISKILILQKKYAQGHQALCHALSLNPKEASTLAEAADIEALYGHARQSRFLFQRAFSVSKDQDKSDLCIRFADAMQTWGDYYQAEKIYLSELKKKPDSLDLWLKLAQNYWSSKRYEEAEGVYYRLLAVCPNQPKVLFPLAQLKLLEKDYEAALQYSEELLSQSPAKQDYIQLKADIYFQKGCYRDSIVVYSLLLSSKKYGLEALIKTGRSYLKLAQNQNARIYFLDAHQRYPDDPEAKFYSDGFINTTTPEYIQSIICTNSSPQRLEQWANAYADNKFVHVAIQLFSAAVQKDPDYLPGFFGLADMLAADRQFEKTTCIYEKLNQEFPQSARIMIHLARVLSWDQQYSASIDMYDRLILLNPCDHLPKIEKGRVAYWDLRYTTSMNSFTSLFHCTVDEQFYRALLQSNHLCPNEFQSAFQSAFLQLQNYVLKGSIYKGYECFTKEFETFKCTLPTSQAREIEKIIAAYFAQYRIQKFAYLESFGLRLQWEKRYLAAIDIFNELLAFSPWNEEALFTLAQAYCTIGLCDCAAHTYCRLLHMTPLHKLAEMALKRERLKDYKAISDEYYYWKESGRGGLDGVAKNRDGLTLEIPFTCRSHVRIIDFQWNERALFNQQIINSNEQSIEADAIVNRFFDARAGIAQKIYFHEFKTRYTGFAHLGFNFYNGLRLDIGFDRTNELYNLFGYQQGIQANIWSITASSDIHHRLNMIGWIRNFTYNDHNNMQEAQLISTYTFTDSPKSFQIALWGQFRNTAHNDIFIYEGATLVTIIHPYWTPQNYYCAGITFAFNRDFAPIAFCGNQQRFADLRVTLQMDTENNPGVRVEGEIKHEFFDRWSLSLKALVHRSSQWNAEGFWGTLKCKF